MKEEYIDQLHGLRVEEDHQKETFARLKSIHEQSLAKIEEARKKLVITCDHRNPDGTSAWKSGFFYGRCDICGMSDD